MTKIIAWRVVEYVMEALPVSCIQTSDVIRSRQSKHFAKFRVLLVASLAESLLNFRGALIDDLVKMGAEVHVAAPGLSEAELSRALRERGAITHEISLQRTGINPWADFTAWIGLWQLVRRVRPNVLLAYTIKPVVYGLLAARCGMAGRRYALITGLGYTFNQEACGKRARLVAAVAHTLYRIALRGAHRVFFQNPDDEALFRKLKILAPSTPSQIVHGSGVDLQHFVQSAAPRESISFLMIARLLGAKGVREYAQAAVQVRKEFPNTAFRLAGWIDGGPDSITTAELETWVDGGVFEYLGRLDDVRPALRDCSVYVLPSYREGTPRTVLEAMATGRPVITTDAPGCRETVIEGENGYLVTVQSSDSLAAAMRRFLIQPDLVQRMGARSRQIAEEKYDVRLVNTAMLRGMGIVP